MPKWATSERKRLLAHILSEYLAPKYWQVDVFTGEYYCPDYETRTKPLIRDWVEDDRDKARCAWRTEEKLLHARCERQYPLRGQFSAVSREIYAQAQPLYRVEAMGLSPLTLKPFALVRLSSTYIGLHVNIGDTLKRISKNAKHKALRYGKRLPVDAQLEIDALCRRAVNHWLEH